MFFSRQQMRSEREAGLPLPVRHPVAKEAFAGRRRRKRTSENHEKPGALIHFAPVCPQPHYCHPTGNANLRGDLRHAAPCLLSPAQRNG